MLKCGLLGEKLGHSYSPFIHEILADYDYRLYEVQRDGLEDFILNGEWDGLNVTIPYKKDVIKYCRTLSPAAKSIGAVNVLVKHADGSISGENTDVYGFAKMLEETGTDVTGKKALVLGSGGASASASAVLAAKGANTVVISRSGDNNYDNLYLHKDAKIIVNTTPVGMYPGNGEAPVDLKDFRECELVLDVIYNPSRTALMLQAEELGIKTAGGLRMLAAQAERSCELFTGKQVSDSKIDLIVERLTEEMENIILIGMPGCGKSTIAGLLGIFADKEVIEVDRLITEKAGKTIPEIFAIGGEAGFRRLESQVLAEVTKLSDKIISTGGGCVTVAENYRLLHQNGKIVWLKRDLSKLPKDGRPLSLANDVTDIYNARKEAYERFADIIVENDGEPEETAKKIADIVWKKD